MTVAFLTHPLGERDAGWGQVHGDNLANALGWLRFLKQATGWAICYPSMSYAAAGMDDVFFRRSMLTDAIEIMERCDVLVLVGGHVSPHMRIELRHAHGMSRPLPVLDLLDLGPVAPTDRDSALAVVRKRADALDV